MFAGFCSLWGLLLAVGRSAIFVSELYFRELLPAVGRSAIFVKEFYIRELLLFS